MDDASKISRFTASICEEALQSLLDTDPTLARKIEATGVKVRDFMILSFVCDQDEMRVFQLMKMLGLGRETICACTERLAAAGLLIIERDHENTANNLSYRPTVDGRLVAKKILGN